MGQEVLILRIAEEEKRGYHPTRQEKRPEEDREGKTEPKPWTRRAAGPACMVDDHRIGTHTLHPLFPGVKVYIDLAPPSECKVH